MKFIAAWTPPIIAAALLSLVLGAVRTYFGIGVSTGLAAVTIVVSAIMLLAPNDAPDQTPKTQPTQDQEDWKP